MKKNVVLADCPSEEIADFCKGMEEVSGKKYEILSTFNAQKVKGSWKKRKTYVQYFSFPLSIVLHRKQYDIVAGWQQFYAINFAFFSKLGGVKKTNKLVVVNFTYKEKKGLLGKLYFRFMKWTVTGSYIDYFHVPSHKYAERCHEELGIPMEKFIITTFGIPDISAKWKDSVAPMRNYSLAIGRSNRDFDFLVRVWSRPEMKDKPLVILTDVWKPSVALPKNILHFDNVFGDDTIPWIKGCEILVVSIDDGNICSGDTVLLKGMRSSKTVVVTVPSTLGEMYLRHEEDGICLAKNEESFAAYVKSLLGDEVKRKLIGMAARQSYLEKFSRYTLGSKIAEYAKLKL